MVANIRQQIKPFDAPKLVILPKPDNPVIVAKPVRKINKAVMGGQALSDLRAIGIMLDVHGIGWHEQAIVERVRLALAQRDKARHDLVLWKYMAAVLWRVVKLLWIGQKKG